MKEEELEKIYKCSTLLPDPGGQVVKDLVNEIKRLRRALISITLVSPARSIKNKTDNENWDELDEALLIAREALHA